MIGSWWYVLESVQNFCILKVIHRPCVINGMNDIVCSHINTFRPGDAIWLYRCGSTLDQVMVWYLFGHYLNVRLAITWMYFWPLPECTFWPLPECTFGHYLNVPFAITWISEDYLSIGHPGAHFSEIWIKIQPFCNFIKIHFKMSVVEC